MSNAHNDQNHNATHASSEPVCDCCNSTANVTLSENPLYIPILLSEIKKTQVDKVKNALEFSRRQQRAYRYPCLYAQPNWQNFHYYPRYYFCIECQTLAKNHINEN
jgi:hypothetical protein